MGRMNGRVKRKRGGFDPSSVRPNKLIKTEAKGLRVIHEKLGNSAIGEFLPALHSLGALASDGSEAASAIMHFGGDKELVHQLLPFLSHQDYSVQLAAAGALRNLSSCGNERHIEQLLQCGVLTPLCLLLSKECNATDKVQLHEQHAVLEQAAYILYNLCELSAEATEAASESAVSALLQHVHTGQPALPPTARLAVHTALLCLTENNPKACAAVERISGQLERIVADYSADSDTDGLELHDAVTVAGILTNLGKCEVRSSILNSVMCLISHSLALTPAGLLQQHVVVVPPADTTSYTDEVVVASPGTALAELDHISLQGASNSAPVQEEGIEDGMREEEGTNAAAKELVMHLQHQMEGKDGAVAQDTGAVTTAAWTKLQHLLGAQQIALELLNNLCCGDDDESCDEASGTLKQEGLVKWTEEENFMEEEDDQWEHTDDVTDLVEVLQPVLQQHGVFERVLEILQPANPAVLQALSGSKYNSQLQALLSGVRSRGLSTLQAVIECLEADQLGGPAKLFQCWSDIARLAFQEGKFVNTCRSIEGEEELEGATGALRALIAKFGPEDSHHLAAITQQDLKVLLSAGSSCGGAGARRNLSRLVGLLGCLLLGRSSPSSLLQDPGKGIMLEATEFLLLLAGNDQSLVVSAEALDVVMDLYAEDNTDKLALETRLIDRLPQILDYFNARYKKARRDEALMQHKVLFVTVKENLPEFIKYKLPRVRNVDSEKKHAKKEQTVGGKGKGKGAGEASKSSKRERRK